MKTAFSRRWSALIFAAVAIATVAAPVLRAEPGSSDDQKAPAAAGELKPVAVIAGAPYEKLIADITFLGSLGGKPELGQMVEGGLAFFTQGKAATAIDKKQPWGVIVQTDGMAFLPVGCLPVIKADDLLGVVKNYGMQIKDGGDGIKEVVMPNQRSIFVKQDGGMAFIGATSASLGKLPTNPQQLLGKVLGDYDIAARVSIKNIPEMYRQFALQQLQAGVQQNMKKKDDQTDEQFEAQQKMTQAQMEQLAQSINETDSATFGWAVDSQQQRTYIDFTTTFVPGTKSAKQMAFYENSKTDFAGFYKPDAAATMTMSAKGDPELMAGNLAQLDASMNSAREQLNREIDKKVQDEDARDALKATAADFFDALTSTIKAGQMDGGGSLQLSADSMTLVAGAHMADTSKVESALKKLEAAAKKSPDFPGIKWNAANHAGVTFNTITVPVPEGEEGPRKLLGEELNVAVGIAPQAVYVAAGKDNIEAANKAIDASAAEKGKSVPPFELAISLAPIMEVAASQAKEGPQQVIVQKVADYLKNEAQGRDHIRVLGTAVPNGVKYHLEAEEGVLKAIGTATTAAQQQKMEAHQ